MIIGFHPHPTLPNEEAQMRKVGWREELDRLLRKGPHFLAIDFL
jgi:hypothetical protein